MYAHTNCKYPVYFSGRFGDFSKLNDIYFFPQCLFRLTSNELLLARYKQQSNPGYLFNRIIGSFAITIWDQKQQQLILARDPLGVQPLFYATGKKTVVGDHPAAMVADHPELKQKLNDQWAIDYLRGADTFTEDTIYKAIKRVEPGYYIVIQNNQVVKKVKYTDIEAHQPIEYKNDNDYIDHYCDLMEQITRDTLRGSTVIGCELSAGIDSTLVTAAAKNNLTNGQRIKTFSHVMSTEQQQKFNRQDESNYVQQVQQCLSLTDNHAIIGDPDSFEAAFNAVASHGMPSRDYYTSFSDNLMAKAQQQQVNVMLSGFGGDECATSHASVSPFELMKHWQFKELYQMEVAPGPMDIIKALKFAKRLMRSAGYVYGQPIYKLKRRIKPRGFLIDRNRSVLNQSTIKARKIPRYTRTFSPLACTNQREMLVENLFGSACGYLRSRLECSALSAKHYDLTYAFPLLDQRLVRFCLNIPNRMRKHRGMKRYLARQAIARFTSLPATYRSAKSGPNIISSIPRTHGVSAAEYLKRYDLRKLQPILQYIDLEALHKPHIKPAIRMQCLSLISFYARTLE
ncbi:MAG: asparagine synthase-related protein [Coxiellaceae bacterium]|nr:asparagine synthase-related protein [Coxiellaceae bacterium]